MKNNVMNMLNQIAREQIMNPQALLQNIMMNNPGFAQQLQGKNPRDYAISLLQSNNIDPMQILRMFGMK